MYSDLNSFGFKLPYKIDSQIAIYGTYTIIENERFDNVKMSDVLERLSKIVDNHKFEIEREDVGYLPSNIADGKLSSDYIYPRLQEFLKENDILFADTGVIPHGVYERKFIHKHFGAQLAGQLQQLWGRAWHLQVQKLYCLLVRVLIS